MDNPGFPGGKGPDKATKFVVHQGPFQDGADTTTQIRQPVYSAAPLPRPQRSESFANILCTVLTTVAVAAPFSQDDWSTPKSHPVRDSGDWAQNLQGTTLRPVPFSQEDWNLPSKKVGQQYDIPNRLPLGTVQAQAPFSQSEWGVPDKKSTYVPGSVHRVVFTVPDVAPFTKYEWAEAEKKQTLQQESTQSRAILAAPAAVPFSQEDWSGPGRKLTQPQEITVNLLPLAPVAGKPFAQLDWSIPHPARDVDYSWLPNLQGTLLSTTPGVPFAQLDWSTADKARTTLTGLNVHRVLVEPPGTPFVQLDWSTPDKSEQAISVNYEPQNFLAINTPVVIPPDVIFVRGGDDVRKKKKRKKSSVEELNALLDRVVEETVRPVPPTPKMVKKVQATIVAKAEREALEHQKQVDRDKEIEDDDDEILGLL